ncbi:substrate-binding periplasmic protein [Pseudoalteromonas pernae]|uniref:substrate-binding periplasmic protein n=1 Tax=Pseudoalteromonas pernae TaxID=3118054 RepID=UPI003242B32A
MKKCAVSFMLLLAGVFSSFTWSANSLHFVAEDLYPLHFENHDKEPQGFLVDVVKAVLIHCGCDGRVEIMPQARAFKELQETPNILMMSLLKTPSREQQFRFLGPVYNAHAYLLGLKERQFTLTDLQSARGLRVSTVRGYYSQQYLEQAGFSLERDLVLAPEPASLMKMLYKERTDLVLTNTLSLDKELKNIGLNPRLLEKKLRLNDFPNELHITANKQLPQETADKISASLQAIKESGHYQALLNKWQLKLETE